jgi:hypothetical protein
MDKEARMTMTDQESYHVKYFSTHSCIESSTWVIMLRRPNHNGPRLVTMPLKNVTLNIE